MLGTTSSNVNQTYPAYITAAKIGVSHAVIRLALEVSKEWKTHFPHRSAFLPLSAPVLRSHSGANDTASYLVAIVLVVHSNMGGTDNVPSGNIGEDTKQLFGDTHGLWGTTWPNVTI